MNRTLYRPHLLVLGLYLLLTLGLTWPLAAHLASHIPGEATWAFDESTFIWNMWWLKHSVLLLGQSPLETTYTFFPLGVKLTTYTFNLFNAALGLPLQLAVSLPAANNLVLLFSYVSSGYGTFLLVRYLLHRSGGRSSPVHKPAAFIAGAVYAFSASRMMYVALGHYNFVTIQWFPFYALFLLKSLREGRAKNIALAGLFAAFCLYAELTFSVFLLFLTVILVTGEWAAARRNRRAKNKTRPAPQAAPTPSDSRIHHSSFIIHHSQLLLRPLLIGLLTFMLTAPFVLAVLPDFLDPAYAEPGWGEGLKLSADLAGLVSLTPLHPLAGVDWIAELRAVIEGSSRFSDANTLFLGYGILLLALLGFLAKGRAAAAWLWSVIIFTVLSLGPLLTINGQNRFDLDGIDATFPLPFALLHYIPILSANRVPNRFGIPLTLAMAVLVGYGAAWLLARVQSPEFRIQSSEDKHSELKVQNSKFKIQNLFILSLAAALLLILLLFDQYSVPLPLTDARIPEVYYHIGAEPGPFTVMQLPLGWRNSYGTLGAERTQLQYYQAAHQKPMLGGNTSRNPSFKFDYFANIPLIEAITEAELYRSVDETTLEQARQQAAALMTLYNIRYLVIHEPIPFRKPYEDTYLPTRQLALDLIPHQAEPIYRSPGVEAFAVTQAPIPDPLLIDLGDWPADPYRGAGWAGNEQIFAATANWVAAPEAELFFPVRGAGERQVTVHVAPFSYPGQPEQQLRFLLNGQLLPDSFSLRAGWQEIELPLPAALLVEGLNRLTLRFAHTAQPRQVLPANYAIGQTGRAAPVDLEVNSGVDFAFITVGFGDDVEDASAHRRGINVAVMQPDTGQLVSVKGFDTAANTFEAEALRQFIAEIPAGQIVVLASQGAEATAFLDEQTIAALQTLGLTPELLTPPFSAIGVKGAPGGTALQATGEGSAYLRLGASPDIRPLAAAVDKVIITAP